MKVFLDKFIGSTKKETSDKLMNHDLMKRQVAALYSLLTNLYGSDKLVLRAGKLEALQYMRSERLEERVLALQKLVFEDPTYDTLPAYEEIPAALDE